MAANQPYLGAFLLKDEDADSDIIETLESVHRVGVFAQITSIFPASGPAPVAVKADAEKPAAEEIESLTAVLYPHRRIKITELLPARPGAGTGPKVPDVVEVDELIRKREIAAAAEAASGAAEVVHATPLIVEEVTPTSEGETVSRECRSRDATSTLLLTESYHSHCIPARVRRLHRQC